MIFLRKPLILFKKAHGVCEKTFVSSRQHVISVRTKYDVLTQAYNFPKKNNDLLQKAFDFLEETNDFFQKTFEFLVVPLSSLFCP